MPALPATIAPTSSGPSRRSFSHVPKRPERPHMVRRVRISEFHKRIGLDGLPNALFLWWDSRLFRKLEPPLAPSYEQWRALKLELDPVYERYVAVVSERRFAASLETSAFLWHLCRATEATSILDLGSGFTSYVFRRYKDESSHPVRVVSVDHDVEWLDRTRRFLLDEGASSDGLIRLEDLPPAGRFTLIYNDFHGPVRVNLMRKVAGRADVIVYDDADRWRDRRELRPIAQRFGLTFYDASPWTRDFLGRWALLLRVSGQ